MTPIEKLKATWDYLLQRGSLVYWVGGAVATFFIQYILFNEFTRMLMMVQGQRNISNSDLLQILEAHRNPLLMLVLLVTVVSIVVLARALDSAVRVSEGDFSATHYAPVARIGWQGVLKYIAGSIIIALMIGLVGMVVYLLLLLLGGILGQTLTVLLMTAGVLVGLVAVFYVVYASMLVFIDSLSLHAMISPMRWREKVGELGRGSFLLMILLIFAVSMAAGFAQSVWEAVVGSSGILAFVASAVFANYLLMFGVVYVGFFARSKPTSAADTPSSADCARLLHEADTHAMDASEKQRFASDLQRADSARAQRHFAEAIAMLAPYVRNDEYATRYFPAYQRLYAWYQEAGEAQQHRALQTRIIHIAAQGHERFYQLVDNEVFAIAQENNAHIPADDVYGLTQMALAHQQPNTVLALVKDFRKRQPEHPQLIKIYAAAVSALINQGRNDVAKQIAERLIADFPEHPDIAQVEALQQTL